MRGIPFSEMAVLAPNLEVYAPLIELVFSDPELEIPYRMSDIDQLARDPFWQGFKRLLKLARSRWEADTLLELFENSTFREKQHWDLERLGQIRKWISSAKIRWGRDPEQLKSSLTETLGKPVEPTSRGTWDEGAERIVSGMVYLFPEEWTDLPSLSPISGVGLGDADEVEGLLSLIEELQRDLLPLSDPSPRSLESWAQILTDLAEKYLGSGGLDEILYSVRSAGEKISGEFPFSSLSHLFERRKSGSVGSHLLHAVRFASLKEGMITPCRALFLIGQDEKSFPSAYTASSLDLLRGTKEAPPFSFERDRYLFLEAISSVKDLLVVSFGHISPEDGKERGPSIVVRELLSYLEENVSECTHPSFPLHARCFQGDSQSMSRRDFRAAQIFYSPKEPLKFLRPFDQRPSPIDLEGEMTVSLKDLTSLFRHPWRFYLQKIHHMRIEEGEKENWEDFEVDFIKRSQILKESFRQPLNAVIGKFEQKGGFPLGMFGEIAEKNLKETFDEWSENFRLFELEGSSLHPLHLRDLPSGEFEFPPLEVPFRGALIKIVGDVKYCSKRGPLHIGDDSMSALLKGWPEYLVALCTLQSNSLFCLRSGKVKSVSLPLEALRNCLDLYFLGLQAPLPLISDWVEPLLRKEDPKDLQKKIDAKRTMFEDPVHDWLLSRIEEPSAEAIFSAWMPYLKNCLSALIDLYPTRGKHGTV